MASGGRDLALELDGMMEKLAEQPSVNVVLTTHV
jgi:hypothetical protein